MARLLHTLAPATLVGFLTCAAPPPVASACGPSDFGTRAEDEASALRHLLEDEAIPLIDPGWRPHYLVLAWARAHGKRFGPAELRTLLAERDLTHRDGPRVREALRTWRQARRNAGATPVEVEAHRQQDYAHRLACPPDAFLSAAETLNDRRQRYSPAELQAWLAAQDAVFAQCAHPDAPLPTEAERGSSAEVRADREYQRAAALLLRGEHALAAEAFDAIAATSSRWSDLASYRSAYARYLTDTISVLELRARRDAVHDTKARRALQQLVDRSRYRAPSADPIALAEELGERLVHEDVGEDVVRVVRDIVALSRRGAAGCRELPLLASAGELPPECHATTPLLEVLVAAHREAPHASPARGDTVLALNHHYHRVARLLHRGREEDARRALARLASIIDASSASTRNAFDTLRLYANPAPLRASALLRRVEDGGLIVMSDGRQLLRSQPSRRWLPLLADLPAPFAERLARDGLARTLLVGSSNPRPFAEWLAEHSRDPEPRAGLVSALAERSSRRRERSLLLVLVRAHGYELAVEDELGSHSYDRARAGCRLGRCHAHSPAFVSATRAPTELRASRNRRRLLSERRLDRIGRLVTTLARRAPATAQVPELLHRFVWMTGRASVHRQTSDATGELSREAFRILHRRYPDSEWTERTQHWYR